ncbi:hypothetical protein PISMIDRAFT_255006 [Pisolithus microcarpus 441]|uniref:Unplaced genomic scaffold scaffold_166, whole genome shotgun sequence n=1 Tax=Pisolithus microcarpus 441 TaxID=765257 RepID=A0A0C9XW44_9AGAM|nr:hypothetical protein PISMIDRAFT_255006 [Pisolithus microcarpus 441]
MCIALRKIWRWRCSAYGLQFSLTTFRRNTPCSVNFFCRQRTIDSFGSACVVR